ncbi:TetR/AcrR family transcriptional regulator [Marisediminicola senii]|uniref:TetR/AcrR family transcriptional regulator n=1 Tax=Marisediminicola senii TaxID=2711233 RepID=UPI0013EAF395|nr:TetR/AcrR family transcriptional regulator [Marisediminicola senii]
MARTSGRPRAAGPSPTGLGTRNDILHAAAHLFCTVGYGSTSTHSLAATAGIRQASVYHYFSGKHEILLELLLGTVRPSLDVARRLLDGPEPAESRLWALCVADARLLSGGETNIGSLYLIPELADERFAPFHALRAELEAAYETLVVACGVPATEGRAASILVLGLVESVILQRRREPETIDELTAPSIADAALKVIDVASTAIAAARLHSTALLAAR